MRKKTFQHLFYLVTLWFSLCIFACKKLITIPPPVNTITTSQVFATDQQATEAMAGIYYNMINVAPAAFNSVTTVYAGASSDEFRFFDQGQPGNIQFQNNDLLSTNSIIIANFWQPFYSTIYGCNSIIAGVHANSSIHDSVSNELTGEAEFVRAFSYFYLVNLFGEIPLVTTTDYLKTSLLEKSSVDTIYNYIFADLKDAQSRLPSDYSAGMGQRIVPNKWAATALLARLYLYSRDWADAENEASTIIANTNLYSPVTDLKSVFLINSTEAIWQLQQTNQYYPYNATLEGNMIIPADSNSQPFIYLTPILLNAFENGDNRRLLWVDSTDYLGQYYYYPYKYQIGPAQHIANGAYTEYYMVLRLAEQYIIKSEAEAQLGDLTDAASDLNIIRNRAGLANISDSIVASQASLLQAIYHERQVELFAEWGHRWLDLKRWGTATQLLSANKGITVSNNALLYPIPFGETQTDPNLAQNTGY